MNSPQPSSEETLFASALALPAAERDAFLAEACAGDAALRARITALLGADAAARSFMESPPAADLASAMTRQAPRVADAAVGDRIGRYKLLQKIGEGGCGIVYMAEQQEPVVRRVALKVIKLGMDTKEVIARFEAERQALALMDHPNIARVLDGGATDTGRPFFVMELVRGVPITKFCDEQNLATAKRLELFTSVCHAVQHAHQKGIIHRDLKPSNILVTLHDGVPVPKVIDFGIAKATQGRLTDSTVFTAFEQFIGTPAYMSPEQAEMSGLDIDTRSDIYSLGVLLYEFLTGRPPFDPNTLLNAGLDEIRRIIREVDPPRPSTRLSTLANADQSTIARQRGLGAAQLSTLLRGDLDWIVMRCLEKDRTRRYDTATALAADISRHLLNEPVAARPPSAGYRLRKLVRRHRVAVLAGTAIFLVLVVGTLVSVNQALRASREATRAGISEQLARSEATTSRAIRDFLTEDLLRQSSAQAQTDSDYPPNPDLKLKEALDRAAAKVGDRFVGQPLTEAAVRSVMGDAYTNLGDFAEAKTQLEASLRLRSQQLGPEHPDTLASMHALLGMLHNLGRFAEMVPLAKRTIELRAKILGQEHPDTLRSMHWLVTAYFDLGQFAEMETLAARTLGLQKRVLGLEHRDTLATMGKIAEGLSKRDLATQALALRSEIFEIQKRLHGEEDLRTAGAMHSLAIAQLEAGHAAESAALHTRTIELQRRLLGAEHPNTVTSMARLAVSLRVLKRYREAEAVAAETLTIRTKIYGREHPRTLQSMVILASALRASGQMEKFEQLAIETLEIKRRVLGADHPDTLGSMLHVADASWHFGRREESEKLRRQVWEIRRRVLGPDHPNTLTALRSLASTLVDEGKADEAVSVLRELTALQAKQSPAPSTLTTDQAELGITLAFLGRFFEAEPLLLQAADSLQQTEAPEKQRRRVAETLIHLYMNTGKPEEAARWQTRVDDFKSKQSEKQAGK
jgi:serine/threonine protein kinase